MSKYKYAKRGNLKKLLIFFVIFILIVASALGGVTVYKTYFEKTEKTKSETKIVTQQTENTVPSLLYTEKEIKSEDIEKIRSMIKSMSLHDKICQMIVASPESLTSVENATLAGEKTKEALMKYPVGGIIYFSNNIVDKEQTVNLLYNTQTYSEIPLMLCVDEEGKNVSRVGVKLGENIPDDMYSYKEKGAEKAKENASIIAKYLKKYGFNTDFAPMADTYSNKENTVIGTRAYSDDYKQSAVLIEKAVRGFDKYNMITCLKHFPGHGDTKEDSHQTIAHTKKSLNEIKGEELLPFYSGIKAGADMVMVGHIAVDSLDKNLPSSINKDIVSGLIRNEMGFNGVIITDSLSMDSVKNIKDLSLKAVMAGNDMLLMPENIREAVKSIEEAVKSGNISEEQIDKSVERILKMKYNNGIISF